MAEKTLAESLKEEEEALRRRFIHHTRPKRPLTLKEAMELSAQVSGASQSTLAKGEEVMTEDEKEELVYRLWEEFAASIKAPLDDARKSYFVAGARSAIYELTHSRGVGQGSSG